VRKAYAKRGVWCVLYTRFPTPRKAAVRADHAVPVSGLVDMLHQFGEDSFGGGLPFHMAMTGWVYPDIVT
jgi:hypothetical protein